VNRDFGWAHALSVRLARALALPLALCACSANGDFGRLKPELVTDDIHGWVGRDAARAVGAPVSEFPLTDPERRLRDLAYPLIEPPFDRARWYAIVNEYGVSHVFGWPEFTVEGYSERLLDRHYRSATARYAQLNTDIRNDVVRIPDFFATARIVLDLDSKRTQSLGYVSAVPGEAVNAVARNAENELVIGWVQVALVQRFEAYCFALQRLVIATPSPMAVEIEQSLTLLNTRVAENRLLAAPPFGTLPGGCGPQVAAVVPAVPVISK
jgi:hypothetical protein